MRQSQLNEERRLYAAILRALENNDYKKEDELSIKLFALNPNHEHFDK